MPSDPPLASGSTPIPGAVSLLEVTGLSSYYGPVRAIQQIDLRVSAGELVAIVGGNGAGKTTLLHALSGLQSASAGQIRFDGQDITRWPPHRIVAAGICQVLEGRQVFAPLSVADNLRLGAYRQHGDPIWLRETQEWVYTLLPNVAANPPAPYPAASSRCSPLAAPCSAVRACCCWTNPQWAWRRCWSRKSSGSSSN